MWSNSTANLGGQKQGVDHAHASQMAFAAAKRAKVTKVLSGGLEPPAAASPVPSGSYQADIAAKAGVPPQAVPHVIDGMAKGGRFTSGQAAALKAHHGPLHGAAGAKTHGDILHAVMAAKAAMQAQPLQPPAAPSQLQLQAPGGGPMPPPMQ